MLKSELLEREAEAKRLELSETFDELRARASPGHVLDQLVDYATDSGGVDFFRNLRDQTVANPLALGLVGAGLAWLMMAKNGESRRPYGVLPRQGRMRRYFAGTRERAGNAVSDARHVMSDTASGVRDRVADAAGMASEAAGSVASTARTAMDTAFGAASSFGERARSRAGDTTAAFGDAASAVYGSVAQSAGRTASGVQALASGTAATSRDIFDFCRDQPLVLAGLGLALGAAIGAVFPSTETERQLMGETSDEVKEQTRSLAAESYEKSKSVAQAVVGEVRNRVSEGSRSLADSPSIVPHDEEFPETQETIRPESTGLHDGRR
jgi:ElaB/YqjD/DUF883 family membrane-anchored ribosome-binding protein